MLKRLLWLSMLLRDIVIAPIVYCMPRNSYKILFGAWSGRQFSDNPKYFLLELLSQKQGFKCYWIGDEPIREHVEKTPGVNFILKGSWSAVWHMLTAKYYVCNINWRDELGWIPTCGRVKILNLWHGIPYKKIGACQLDGNGKCEATQTKIFSLRGMVRDLLISWHNWCYDDASWTSVSSEKMGDIMCRAFPHRFSKDRMVMAGLPRNDFLIQNKENFTLQKQLKEKYAALLNLPIDKRWYLYLPTWRHGEGSAFSFMASGMQEKYQEILQLQNAVLIEKQHPIVLKRLNLSGQRKGDIFTINEAQASLLDIQELLLISDRLITDYSSCFFDYSLLSRPCIHYVYDFKEYVERDSGVEYELRDIAVGPLVETEERLLDTLAQNDDIFLAQRGKDWTDPINRECGEAVISLINTLAMK
jgi:CDP-glycerol glycerophosphotransferase